MALVLGILLWCPAAPGWSAPPDEWWVDDDGPPASVDELMDSVLAKLNAGGPLDAYPELVQLLEHRDFGTLLPYDQFALLVALGAARLEQGGGDFGVGYFERAMAMDPAFPEPVDWELTALAAIQASREATAALALAAMARAHPGELYSWPDDMVRAILQGLDSVPDPATRIAVLESLWRMNYTLRDRFLGMDEYWFKLLGLYAGAGELGRADLVAARITEPTVLQAIYLDARFAAIRPADPSAAIRAAGERKLLEVRDLAAIYPARLRSVRMLAVRLAGLERHAEALNAIDGALATIEAAPHGLPAFDDLDTELPSLLQERGARLWALGRLQEGIDAQREAAGRAAVGGSDWMNQQLRLADMLTSFGRPDEALSIVDSLALDVPSTAFAIVSGWIRACALAGKGDVAAARAEVTALIAAAPLDYQVQQKVLLCIGDEAGLTELVLAALERSETRMLALASLQPAEAPAATPVLEQERLRFGSVAGSAAVIAAVEKYGLPVGGADAP